ncbi:hypothetical protein ACFU9X_37570 [Streptomyces atratus]|uniref:ATP-dependent DNA ligase n=1 Tax=Streptomyces atratus TaxID=1893 RepID=UPI0036A4DD7C
MRRRLMSHETSGSLENDSYRTVLRRSDDTVFLYARSGRIVTQHWMDFAVVGMELRPGTVLDGEAVIWRDGRLDFAAAQSRAAWSVTRARALAARYPASYVCWDVIQHPDPAIGDLRSRPYTERRAYLLELIADLGPPIQPVPATGGCARRGTSWPGTMGLEGEAVAVRRGPAPNRRGGQGLRRGRPSRLRAPGRAGRGRSHQTPSRWPPRPASARSNAASCRTREHRRRRPGGQCPRRSPRPGPARRARARWDAVPPSEDAAVGGPLEGAMRTA